MAMRTQPLLLLATVAASLASLPARAEGTSRPTVLLGDACVAPAAPEVPEGASSSAETLAAAQAAVKAYVKKGEDYIVCLTQLEESWKKSSEPVPEEKRKALIANHNHMVDEMRAVADRFNAEVRRFKAAQ